MTLVANKKKVDDPKPKAKTVVDNDSILTPRHYRHLVGDDVEGEKYPNMSIVPKMFLVNEEALRPAEFNRRFSWSREVAGGAYVLRTPVSNTGLIEIDHKKTFFEYGDDVGYFVSRATRNCTEDSVVIEDAVEKEVEALNDGVTTLTEKVLGTKHMHQKWMNEALVNTTDLFVDLEKDKMMSLPASMSSRKEWDYGCRQGSTYGAMKLPAGQTVASQKKDHNADEDDAVTAIVPQDMVMAMASRLRQLSKQHELPSSRFVIVQHIMRQAVATLNVVIESENADVVTGLVPNVVDALSHLMYLHNPPLNPDEDDGTTFEGMRKRQRSWS